MNPSDTKIVLPPDITSPQDLQAISMDVRRYIRWFGQSNIKARVTPGAVTEPITLSPHATRYIQELTAVGPLTQKSLDDLLAALQELEITLPRMTITLAAVPGGNLKKKLVAWCRTNIAPNILVDFRFNATILGGMVVRYGSRIYDYSFRRQIIANRAKFPEVLRRV